ncbi:hypothetical protein NC651_034371 [Populus alba x Populus x berolinensis]|nr:hypothetical protein NC651_034371 [Populus alba x Populus x berolinensis]
MAKDTTTPFWKHCPSSPTLARMKPVQQGNLLQQIRSWTISEKTQEEEEQQVTNREERN